MATTTVRLSRTAKARLDRLQARLVLLTGESLTKEQVLDRLVAHGERYPAHITADDWTPPADDALARMEGLRFSAGQTTREEDIDRDLYGG